MHDFAGAHFSIERIGLMISIMPPNVPQARPIENLWGILAGNL